MNLKAIRDALIIGKMKAFPDLKRQPLVLILVGILSAIPLFFFAVSGGGEMLSHGLIGAMVSSVGFIGINSAIQDIGQDRYVKIREMIVAMPVHPASYAIGVALAPLVLSLPGLAFFILVAMGMGTLNVSALIWIAPVLLLCWSSLSAIGFIISTYLYQSGPYTLNNIANILSIGLVFIPPVYYPAEMLGNLSWISYLIPTSNVAMLVRGYVGLSELSPESGMISWLILGATTIIFTALTALKAKWRET
ncbi:MAG: ABC transporter permease [Candidatus Bathyarchaeota archaeon]|nr:ABC transporter permease [Candidatus Bathyarchaeota archaeon]